MPSLRHQGLIPDRAKLHFSGHLSAQTRYPDGLKAILGDYFVLPVEIEEYVGQWLALPERSRVGVSAHQLGLDFCLGSHVWDRQHTFRIRLGPLTLDGTPIEPAHPVRAERDGAVLRLGPATRGVRYSLAVRGGIAGEPVLGSRSRDTLAALGPAPLTPNDVLAIGEDTTGPVPAVDLVPVDARTDTVTELMVRPGPRRDWFTNEGWQRMLQTAWVVSPRSDRTGVRLDGATLERRPAAVGRELASEGMTPGAMQVSPDGVPTVLGPDHPVTGGYPVIAVVTDDALDRLAQLRPGDPVRLRLATGRP